MNRRSFVTALAGLPIVGWGVGIFGMPKSGITVHGPEWTIRKPKRALSLRFENVPQTGSTVDYALFSRLQPFHGTINRDEWYCCGDIEPPRTWMFASVVISSRGNGLCSVTCEFMPKWIRDPWASPCRPVDFETEILKALTA